MSTGETLLLWRQRKQIGRRDQTLLLYTHSNWTKATTAYSQLKVLQIVTTLYLFVPQAASGLSRGRTRTQQTFQAPSEMEARLNTSFLVHLVCWDQTLIITAAREASTYISEGVLVGTGVSQKALGLGQALHVVFIGSDVVAGVKPPGTW